jgi:ribonuclease HII
MENAIKVSKQLNSKQKQKLLKIVCKNKNKSIKSTSANSLNKFCKFNLNKLTN